MTFTAIGTALITPVAGASQGHAGHAKPAVVDALMRDIAQLEEKLMSLADAIPDESFDWRPAEGVRSVNEVMVHVAADNWFLPTIAGVAAPAETGIKAGDYPSVQAYEARKMSKAEAMEATRVSFAHLRTAMEAADDAALARKMNVFGNEMSGTDLWVITATHLHEHLGQLIAYARSNGVVPPWSR
jgi:uncharacterized damage-inducible protein DinB